MKEQKKIIKGLAGKVRVDGFRKGKIPPAVLKQRFGGSAKSDAATEIVGETLADALTDADVSPATQPSLTNIDTENADSLIYTLEFEVYPEIKVNALSKLTIDQVSSQVTEEDEELLARVPCTVTVPTCVAKNPALVGVLVCDEVIIVTSLDISLPTLFVMLTM